MTRTPSESPKKVYKQITGKRPKKLPTAHGIRNAPTLQPARRHAQIKRQRNLRNVIPNAAIDRWKHSAGFTRMEGACRDHQRFAFHAVICVLARGANIFKEHAKRRTVQPLDVYESARLIGAKLYV